VLPLPESSLIIPGLVYGFY